MASKPLFQRHGIQRALALCIAANTCASTLTKSISRTSYASHAAKQFQNCNQLHSHAKSPFFKIPIPTTQPPSQIIDISASLREQKQPTLKKSFAKRSA
jgi:hypothetical protein